MGSKKKKEKKASKIEGRCGKKQDKREIKSKNME